MVAKSKKTDDRIDLNRLPRHIAIIMDGNGRWAQKKLMPRTMGHRAGMGVLKKVVQTCDELKVPFLTVFAFSTENWKRPVTEVDYLMKLLVEFMHKELNELHANNVQIRVMGDYQVIPRDCQQEIGNAIEMTRHNTGLLFTIALNYGSRQEILQAVKVLAAKLESRELDPESIDEEVFGQLLFTAGIPDPDLLIRTAGEMRISNFMLWQIAYAEIVVTDTLWPDFTRDHLIKAIIEYQSRDRKFGGLN